jgi:hypothetical protein
MDAKMDAKIRFVPSRRFGRVDSWRFSALSSGANKEIREHGQSGLLATAEV